MGAVCSEREHGACRYGGSPGPSRRPSDHAGLRRRRLGQARWGDGDGDAEHHTGLLPSRQAGDSSAVRPGPGDREGLNATSSSVHPDPTAEHEAGERKMLHAECGSVTVILRDRGTVPRSTRPVLPPSQGAWAVGSFGRSRAAPGLLWPNAGSERPCSNSSTSSYQSVVCCAGIIFLCYGKALGGPSTSPPTLHPKTHPAKPGLAVPRAMVSIKP